MKIDNTKAMNIIGIPSESYIVENQHIIRHSNHEQPNYPLKNQISELIYINITLRFRKSSI